MSKDTDAAWREWGEREPYFGVITDPKYRRSQINDDAIREFFATGEWHVSHVLDTCRQLTGGAFAPKSALDFGCGVGRVAIPLAAQVERVVGLDVSPAMLREAKRNAKVQGRENVEWLLSDDNLSSVQCCFDLVHTCITLQHVAVERGVLLFRRLVECVAPGGIGAIQLTYAKAAHADTFGKPPMQMHAVIEEPTRPMPSALRTLLLRRETPRPTTLPDPEMQMNTYDLNVLFFILQSAGVVETITRFTDHGGELGVFLFFVKPRLA